MFANSSYARKLILFGAMMTLAFASVALADTKAEIKKHPGYVDFEAMKLFEDQEAKVEVYLRDPMIKLLSEVLKHEDEELFEIMSKLKLVRVQIFDIKTDIAKKLSAVTSATAKRLDKEGWERIVRVREDGENVDVYIRPSDDYESVLGIVVMVVGEDDEAVFINIVGDINPEDIGRLGEHFDMDHLEDIHIDSKKRNRN